MQNKRTSLKELARLFTRLGLTAFGGPAAHIAMMKTEVVDKKQWMEHVHFMDLIGATNLIPGPNSTEMAIHIGHERAGWKGLIVAGCCFILPAVIITGVIAGLYRTYGQLPVVTPFIYGIKPAIIAIILAAIFPLAKKSLKSVELGIIGVRCRAIHPGTGIFIGYFYWLANERSTRCNAGYDSRFSAIVYFCCSVKPADTENAKIPFIFGFSGRCKYRLRCHYPDGLYQFWERNNY